LTVLDANLLLYAYDSASAQHTAARAWIEQLFSGSEPVALPWPTICAFLRIMTNPRLPGERFTLGEATLVVESWFAQPNIRALGPGENHWQILSQLLVEGQAAGPLISDAHLAAITIEHGGVLHTTDRDFSRFSGLRWKNPLQV
jgi:toxin-antitoxin system PIN domain toxin